MGSAFILKRAKLTPRERDSDKERETERERHMLEMIDSM